MLGKLSLMVAAAASDARLHAGKPHNETALEGAISRGAFANSLLSKLGFPVSQNNLISLVGWMQAEGSPCGFNPLDTTQGFAGARNCNSVGVKIYPSYADGVAATVNTLHNGYYGGILSALHASEVPTATGEAIATSKWGTGKLALECITDAYRSPSTYASWAAKAIAQ